MTRLAPPFVPRPRRAVTVIAVVLAAVIGGCLPPVARGSAGSDSGAASGAPSADSPAPSSPAPTSGGPSTSPSFVRPTPTPVPTFLVHTVARGESLGTLAKRYGTTARSIAFWNRATYPSLDPESAAYRPDLLQVGWTLLVIPGAVFDEQTLPEPSEFVTPPSELPSAPDDPTASDETG